MQTVRLVNKLFVYLSISCLSLVFATQLIIFTAFTQVFKPAVNLNNV